MRREVAKYAAEISKKRKNKKRWMWFVAMLSAVVVFCTAYALILPAITMECEVFCGKEEHQHSGACFTEPAVHQHTQSCYDGNGVIVCGCADFVIHTHDEKCYDINGELICNLPEISVGGETQERYLIRKAQVISETHTHDAECYARELVCTLAEEDGHAHGAECYDETGALICEKEDFAGHQHGEACYENVLTCELSEETQKTDILPETAKVSIAQHTHISSCYNEAGELICGKIEIKKHQHTEACITCGKEEHAHGLACYSDPTADLETEQIWEKTLSGVELTGDWAENLIAIAETQLGYRESTKHYEVLEDGTSIKGYTRYGEWYGNPCGHWCAMFASFCLHYAGISEEAVPYEMSCKRWISELEQQGLYRTAEDFAPEKGDLIFFDLNHDGESDHVGIVRDADLEENKVFTIEGNRSSAVMACEYAMDSNEILGYCDLSAAYSAYQSASAELTEQELTAELYTDNTYTEPLQEGAKITVLGMLPENAVVRAYPIDPENEELTGVSLLYAYDITVFTAEGTEFQPAEDAPLKVTFGIPGESIREDYKDGIILGAAHISDLGEAEELEPVIEEDAVSFTADHFSTFVIYQENVSGESAPDNSAFRALAESGYFTYWEQFLTEDEVSVLDSDTTTPVALGEDSSVAQITNEGGTNTSGYDDNVSVSKTIAGTELENVFDITLEVNTSTNISEFYREPDMAVVIVMDISNTMQQGFTDSEKVLGYQNENCRYAAAIASAEQFIDKLASVSNGVSKVGFVAFNTDATKIFDLSSCSNTAQATSLKHTMRQGTGAIIGATGYDKDHHRFTNIEAGLKMGYDMLQNATNENKYIIFLSDGFPTTYIRNGYTGYDPFMTESNLYYDTSYLTNSANLGKPEVFYDYVNGVYCKYGTSYSDTGAIRARKMATQIKDSGVKIFSIGVAIGAQTIKGFEVDKSKDFSVIERSASVTTQGYEIGSYSDSSAFKNWLRDKIGSGDGYYYDSTDKDKLSAAYDDIFKKIQEIHEAGSSAQWVATDPMGTVPGENIEFIGFYDKDGKFVENYGALTGSWDENAENTASVNTEHSVINWDLKTSGYTTSTENNTTMYHYSVTYRVRLENELSEFIESASYNTNNTTTLTYKTFQSTDGNITFSEQRTIEFQIPAVKGYLGELTFLKTDTQGNPLSRAEFALTHDTERCSICRGDGTSVAISEMTAVSDENGRVSFSGIPSGHVYALTETKPPDGHALTYETYTVTVAYDVVTVAVTQVDGSAGSWDGTIVNPDRYQLPKTGGRGVFGYFAGGVILILLAGGLFLTQRRKKV